MGMFGATAWHGSPHKFDKFKMEAIGTGEGAQAYGHGLYLAENPKIAQDYKYKLSQGRAPLEMTLDGAPFPDPKISWTNPDPAQQQLARIKTLLLQEGGDVDKAIARTYGDDIAELEKYRGRVSVGQPGQLYKTDIPDEAVARMLDWDKPLRQQAPEVQNALQSMVGDVTKGGFDLSRSPRNVSRAFDNSTADSALKALQDKYGVTNSGGQYFDKNGNPLSADVVQRHVDKIAGKGYDNAGQLYSDLMHIVGSQSDISATMRNNGIPGIRYLDGGSRSAGQGSSNFVVFDPEMIRILERNGQATGKMPWKRGEFDLKDTTYEPPLFPDTTR